MGTMTTASQDTKQKDDRIIPLQQKDVANLLLYLTETHIIDASRDSVDYIHGALKFYKEMWENDAAADGGNGGIQKDPLSEESYVAGAPASTASGKSKKNISSP